MAEVADRCPHCQSEAVVKYGKTSNDKERFRCQQRELHRYGTQYWLPKRDVAV